MSEGKSAATPQPHKDADTPDELTRWIWDKYVGVPVAGQAWGQEFENLLDRVRRMDRSSFTKGLHEARRQYRDVAVSVAAPKAQPEVNGRGFSWTPATAEMDAHVWYGDGDSAAAVYGNLALEVDADELAKRIAGLLNEACAPKAGEPPQLEKIVLDEIASSTGPTGGWLDSPKALVASIVAKLRERGAGETPAERWIPVEERLPDKTADVLIFVMDDHEGNKNFITIDSLPFNWDEEVTHWRLLPLPPVRDSHE